MRQAQLVAEAVRARDARLEVSIHPIRTEGDELSARGVLPQSGKALFTSRIERALEGAEVDLAVHSLKDLPAAMPDSLTLAAVPLREDPRDALITRAGGKLATLPLGAEVATSSLRRTAQLRAARRDLVIRPLHGNVETRLRKLGENGWGGIVLAVAGLRRLGLDHHIHQTLSTQIMLPAPGQGALAVQARVDDEATLRVAGALDHAASRARVEAERALAERLGGDCNVPIGALAMMHGGRLILQAVVASPDGTRVIRLRRKGKPDAARELGAALADQMLAEGADEILEACRT